MATATATRAARTGTVAGTTWEIDAAHTLVEFAVRHLMISKVKGRFTDVAGTIVEGENAGDAQVEVSIDAASIDTREAKRDAHLKSPDFLDVENYPTIRFASRQVKPNGDGRYQLVGDLTIRGVTREVTLDVTSEGTAMDPWGGERVGYAAKGRINRKDFGVEWNVALEAGGWLVGEEVDIVIEVQAVRKAD